jgi:hypothetical protein
MALSGKKNLPQGGQASGAKALGFQPFFAAIKENSEKKEFLADASEVCGGGENRVEVVRSEGVVSRIRVYCRCGEVTEIECDYLDP